MATHSRSLPQWGGAWGISAIGAMLLVAALAAGSRLLTAEALSLYPIAESIVVLGLCGTVLASGYRLRRSYLTDRELWRIAIWVSLGVILLIGLTTWQLLTQIRGGATLRDPLVTLVMTQTVGATVGLVVGTYHVQSLRNERRAENATAKATEARAAQDQLAFVHTLVRHHLRNGMHVIQSYARHLESHVDDEGATHLETIQRRSERLVALVDELRPLAEAIDADERLEPTALATLVEREAAHFEITRPESSIEIEADRDVSVRADSLLSAAVENLLRSAIERSAVREPTVTIRIDRVRECGRITITASGPVLDGGFDRHVLDAARDSIDGSDVDVHVAREVLERYDGRLSVERDGGPRFVVRLPVATEA